MNPLPLLSAILFTIGCAAPEPAECTQTLRVKGSFTLDGSEMRIQESAEEGLEFVMHHKVDIDTYEAGCLSQIGIRITRGGLGCTLFTVLDSTDDGEFIVSDLSIAADSFCQGFSDDIEGRYALSEIHSTVTGGIPNQIRMEDSTAMEVCASLEFRFQSEGTLYFEGDGGEHNFNLDLTIWGDTWSQGSTTADCRT